MAIFNSKLLNYQRVPSPSHHRFFGCYVFHPLLKLWGSDADPPVQQDEDHACHQGGSFPPTPGKWNKNVMKPRPPWPILFDDLPYIYVQYIYIHMKFIYNYINYIYMRYINMLVHSHGQLYGLETFDFDTGLHQYSTTNIPWYIHMYIYIY